MRIVYDKKTISEMLRDISLLTGISLGFVDADYNFICKEIMSCNFCEIFQKNDQNKALCERSDRELFDACESSGTYSSHICPAGLYDAAFPIKKNGITAGYIIMGRIRHARSLPPPNVSELGELYSKLPFFRDDQLEALRSLLPKMLFSNAIMIENDEVFLKIKQFIDKNYDKEITINSICKQFYISKNHLYKCFHENCGSTVNDYLTKVRLDHAKKLLSETSTPVSEICEMVGISNYTYFCRLFKSSVGISATDFRRSKK